jgi:hypothetical protein
MQVYHSGVLLYAVVSVVALAALPMSAAGWISPDPLSAIPAVLLGLPWSYLLTELVGSQSSALNAALLALAMVINAGLIWLIGDVFSRG